METVGIDALQESVSTLRSMTDLLTDASVSFSPMPTISIFTVTRDMLSHLACSFSTFTLFWFNFRSMPCLTDSSNFALFPPEMIVQLLRKENCTMILGPLAVDSVVVVVDGAEVAMYRRSKIITYAQQPVKSFDSLRNGKMESRHHHKNNTEKSLA